MRRRFFSSNSKLNIDNYLTIYALEDGLTASLSYNMCEYCVDGDGNWISLSANTTTQPINSGQTLSFRGNLTPEEDLDIGIGTFTISKACNLIGNCMSMLFGDNALNENSLIEHPHAFSNLFKNNAYIKEVSENFLPATTLSYRCYYNMFRGCTNLIVAPELLATTLVNNCYMYMFYGCTNLSYIKMLATSITATYCLYYWVYGVSGTGTFVKNSKATWDVVGVSGVPTNWTIITSQN